jgi:hypothetical protein
MESISFRKNQNPASKRQKVRSDRINRTVELSTKNDLEELKHAFLTMDIAKKLKDKDFYSKLDIPHGVKLSAEQKKKLNEMYNSIIGGSKKKSTKKRITKKKSIKKRMSKKKSTKKRMSKRKSIKKRITKKK